ncbi:MAG: hypothetical protein HYS87_00800 [Candidatus Colwellbacteria bacterium]|nr:hypothetical protein [Candidatus Colwellbacteria bacterium]
MNKFLRLVLVAATFTVFFGVNTASAAILKLSSDKETAAIGDTITVDVQINSEGIGVNAAEAAISFPTSILEVTSLSKTDSIFNFWLEEPAFDNTEGRVTFVGGATSGKSGQSLQVLNITFRVKGGGEGNITFLDGAVTASDGSGTNVLREFQGVTVNILAGSQVVPGVTPSPVAPPVQIERPAVPTGNLPVKPEVQVPLYPDPEGWFNIKSKFSAIWSLPDDVTNVDTLINKIPTSSPVTSEGLFEAREFVPLDDGIWYLHVRFRNNIGWGPTTHYRIAIDTAPPVEFNISSDVDGVTDNPSPTLTYQSGDDLSGLEHYAIRAIGGEVEYTNETTYKIKPLPPGAHTIVVAAVDNAGNRTEASLDIEILPIESPVITFFSERVILDEQNISIAGTALAEEKVRLVLRSERGDVAAQKDVAVDPLGNWSGEFSEASIRRGNYVILATTVDSRGAQSLPAETSKITVKDKPLLSLFGIDISKTWFFVLAIIFLAGAFAGGFWFEKKLSEKRSRDLFITRRDVVNAFKNVEKEIDAIMVKYADQKIDEREAREIKTMLLRLKENTANSAKYIGEQIGEIEK